MSGIIIFMIYSDMNHSYDANQGPGITVGTF